MSSYRHKVDCVRSRKGDAMRKSLYEYCRENGEDALLNEWALAENGRGPEEVSYGSKIKYWWRCPEGHLYQASATSRTNEHTGCPYCAGKLPIPGSNDLATLYPHLAAEWTRRRTALSGRTSSFQEATATCGGSARRATAGARP